MEQMRVDTVGEEEKAQPGIAIPGGCILLSRMMLLSEIMDKPAIYMKLWVTCLLSASRGREGSNLPEGAFVTTLKDLAKKCGHRVGYRWWTPKGRGFRKVVKWFEIKGMLEVNPTVKGVKIVVINFEFFQNFDNYTDLSEAPKTLEEMRVPQDKVVKAFNEILGQDLQPIRVWNASRRKALIRAWKEDGSRQSYDWWLNLFIYIRDKCPFLLGKTTDFRASIDWILKPKNLNKIVEGNYEQRN